ncbi:glycophorin-C-like [Notothenia coriiceps]|uniref:Glycophorin-C-like n=1 Tax=Notothenia coriiceps TaxID=8208 RepID=A0A6I9NH81_9TELE|nr:PREDICTED: glycophorin-C-like [Notothenia coriiceps]
MADVLTPGPVTPPPAIAMATALHEVMTPMIMLKDSGTSGALIGGMVGSVLLLLICIMVVLIWISSRQKGSYVTNEFNEEEEDEESDAADMEQQSKKPLTAEEHE